MKVWWHLLGVFQVNNLSQNGSAEKNVGDSLSPALCLEITIFVIPWHEVDLKGVLILC